MTNDRQFLQTTDDDVHYLNKYDMRDVFDELKKHHPSVYVIFMETPKEICSVKVIDDDEESDILELSLEEFFDTFSAIKDDSEIIITLESLFPPEAMEEMYRDEFEITGRVKVSYDDPREFSTEELMKGFGPMLVNWCRQAMLRNRPLRVSQAIIDKYSLSAAAVENFSGLLEHCNEKVLADLQTEYDVLKAIDGIRK